MTMTLGEFRAWLDGFSAAIDRAPTEEQWNVIQEKMALIVSDTITTPIIYEPYYQRPQPTWPYWYTTCHAQGANDAKMISLQHTEE